MAKISKNCLPYEGNEPYLYFAFCRTDESKIIALLEQLNRRGCRVWYGTGNNRAHRLERTSHASLVIVFMSAGAMSDQDEIKSTALYCQSKGIPVLVIDAVENNDLSTGFSGGTVHTAYRTDPCRLENEILRTGCITQEMIGDLPTQAKTSGWKLGLAILLATAVVILSGALALGFLKPKDEIVFQDAIIQEAVRRSAGSPIRLEELESITTLHLSGVPESLTELEKLPKIERIEIPAEAVSVFAPLVDQYQVVVYERMGD